MKQMLSEPGAPKIQGEDWKMPPAESETREINTHQMPVFLQGTWTRVSLCQAECRAQDAIAGKAELVPAGMNVITCQHNPNQEMVGKWTDPLGKVSALDQNTSSGRPNWN